MFESYKPRNYNQNFLKAEKGLKIQSFRNRGAKKAIPKVSKRRLADNKIYEIAKTAWRKIRTELDGFRCEVVRDGIRCERRAARNPHHIKGRLGKLLYDIKNFLAACQGCHDYIHANPAWAREQGYLIYEFKDSAEHGNTEVELGR